MSAATSGAVVCIRSANNSDASVGCAGKVDLWISMVESEGGESTCSDAEEGCSELSLTLLLGNTG